MSARRSIIPVFVPHLGCPNLCVFCDQNRISGSQKPATPEDVVQAINEGLAKLEGGEPPTLAFYGGSFTAIPWQEQKALLTAAQPFIKEGKLAGIRVSTRPDKVDEENVYMLKAYNVRTVELGVQSMEPDVLEMSLRGHTPQDAARAARLVRQAGMELILQMMTGLPGDTPEKSLSTARKIVSMRPDGVRIYPTVIIRGTKLYDMWQEGSYKEHTVEDAVALCAQLCDIFDTARIPVIRLGLNPTEDLSGGEAAGGAYHPALGELVLSRRYLERERALVTEDDRGRLVVFDVAPGRTSAAVGHGSCNTKALIEEFGLRGIRIHEREMPDSLWVTRGSKDANNVGNS